MKKKILALLASVLAATMVFGFAGCKDDGSTNGSTNDTTNNQQSDGKVNKKLTEAEWRAAMEEAETYMSENFKASQDTYEVNAEGQRSKISHDDYECDGDTLLYTYVMESRPINRVECYVLDGEDVIIYEKIDDNWVLKDASTAQKKSAKFDYSVGNCAILDAYVERNGEKSEGKLADFYNEFTYDENTNSYSGTIYIYSLDMDGNALKDDESTPKYELQIFFENGKIIRVDIVATETMYNDTIIMEASITYGNAHVESPKVQ